MTSGDRVRANTSATVQAGLDAAIAERVRAWARGPEPALDERIRSLDAEWDVERVLELNASLLTLVALTLARSGRRGWLWLAAGVQAFLALHATEGWCPPLPILRRLGVLTRGELDAEKSR
jgi:hypothetical protein